MNVLKHIMEKKTTNWLILNYRYQLSTRYLNKKN